VSIQRIRSRGDCDGPVISRTSIRFLPARLKEYNEKPPTGKAYVLLQSIGKILEEPKGEYYFTRSTNDNYGIANHIYTHADGTIIATAFHEDPSTYK
jgi:hypothetical protein